MYYTKRCIGSSVISVTVVQSSYFMNILSILPSALSNIQYNGWVAQFVHSLKQTKYHVTFSVIPCFQCFPNITTDCESVLFWQQAVYSNYHYSLLNKPLDISTQEFIFDALTTSIQWLFHKDQRETQGTKNKTIRNSVYGVGGWEIWNSNILEKLNLACLLQGLRS